MEKNELIIFKNGELELEVIVSNNRENVWLTQKQMAQLYNVSSDNVSLHIKNIIKDGELDDSTTEESSVVRKEGDRFVKRRVKTYNLDMILAVGYRVKSPNGILFRKWATSILKDYMIEGYVLNEKKLAVLNKTVSIQTKMLATALNIEEVEVLKVVQEYSNALDLLDNYDHQCLIKPEGRSSIYRITYE